MRGTVEPKSKPEHGVVDRDEFGKGNYKHCGSIAECSRLSEPHCLTNWCSDRFAYRKPADLYRRYSQFRVSALDDAHSARSNRDVAKRRRGHPYGHV